MLQNPTADKTYAENLQKIEDFTEELASLSAAYADELFASGTVVLGPDVESAFERVTTLESQFIEKRIELTGAQAGLYVLDRELSVYWEQIDLISNKAVLLTRFQRDMETSAQLYTTVLQSLQEARIAKQSKLGYVDIIHKAVVPSGPVSPKVPINLLVGAMLGLMLGVAGAFTRPALDKKVLWPEDLRQKGYAVLGIIPDIRRTVQNEFDGAARVDVGGRELHTSLITLLNLMSQAFRRLRTNFDYSATDTDEKIIAINSPTSLTGSLKNPSGNRTPSRARWTTFSYLGSGESYRIRRRYLVPGG